MALTPPAGPRDAFDPFQTVVVKVDSVVGLGSSRWRTRVVAGHLFETGQPVHVVVGLETADTLAADLRLGGKPRVIARVDLLFHESGERLPRDLIDAEVAAERQSGQEWQPPASSPRAQHIRDAEAEESEIAAAVERARPYATSEDFRYQATRVAGGDPEARLHWGDRSAAIRAWRLGELSDRDFGLMELWRGMVSEVKVNALRESQPSIGQHVLGLMKGAAQWLVAWVFLMGLLGLIAVTCNAITQ